MSVTQNKLIELLGSGVTQTQAAQALGVSDSLVSQWLDDPVVREQIAGLKIARLQQYQALDDQATRVEQKALDKLEKALPLMQLSKITDIAKVYSILNSAKRKAAPEATAPTQNAQVVNVIMPGVIMSKFRTSQITNEVIEIDGKPLVTVSPTELTARVQEAQRDSEQKVIQSRVSSLLDVQMEKHNGTDKSAGVLRPIKVSAHREGQPIGADNPI